LHTYGQTLEHYKYMQLIAMVYLTLVIVTIVFAGRLVSLSGYPLAVTTTLMPLRFSIPDIFTEVYGYRNTRRLIWFGIFCELLFLALSYFLLHIFKANHTIQMHYEFVFSRLSRIFIACLLAHVTSNFINVYCISKWKILVKGKYFFFRSLGATFIGLTIFTLVTLFILFWHTIPSNILIKLIITTIAVKIIVEPIFALLATLVTLFLKKAEGTDIYDIGISYNPFSLS